MTSRNGCSNPPAGTCACRLIAGLGCGVHFTGYFAVWLAAKGIVPLPFPVLLGFALLGSSAVVFFDSATIVTCMRNFPNERGNSAGDVSLFCLCTSVAVCPAHCTQFCLRAHCPSQHIHVGCCLTLLFWHLMQYAAYME